MIYRFFFLVLLASLLNTIELNAQTVLNAGDIVIVAINGDTDASNSYGRGFSFMPLVNLATGTIINFTDYGWSDVTGAFITNTGIADAFIHYTAPSSITAGTIIRCDSYTNTNFTFDYTYSGTGTNPYLNIAGLTQGDELLVFQGARSTPTFICAASIVNNTLVASGWATSVGTNGTDGSGAGSALPGSGNVNVADLTDDVTALSFNRPADSNDNCAYTGTTTSATTADWKTRITTYSNWTFNDAAPIPTPPTGPFTISDALPVELTSFSSSNMNGIISLNWQTTTEVSNYGFEIERSNHQDAKWEKIGFVYGHGNSNSLKEYSFIDKPTGGTIFKYRLKQIDIDGQYKYSHEIEVSLEIPVEFDVKQNFPNPFNPSTVIKYELPKASHVSLKIYDMLGKEVAVFIDKEQEKGRYEVTLDGSKLSSGVYICRITAGEFVKSIKMNLIK